MATKTFTDIDASFLMNPANKDILVRHDERAIAFSIKSLILTSNYERPFNSALGTPIKKILFELFGDQLKIVLKRMISDVIRNYEPRVDLINIVINESPNNNSVYISIQYKIKNTERPLLVELSLERTR